MTETNSIILFFFVMSVGALGVIIWGIASFIKGLKFYKTAVVVSGRIINYNHKRVIRDIGSLLFRENDMYSPIIEYEYNGQSHRISSRYTTKLPCIGAAITVHVNPNSPGEAKVNHFGAPYEYVVWVFLGMVYLFMSGLGLIAFCFWDK